MFSRMSIAKSTGSYLKQIERLKDALDAADAIVVGAGAGLSTSAGFVYAGERFQEHFEDFEAKYGFHDMYSGAFCNYDTLEVTRLCTTGEKNACSMLYAAAARAAKAIGYRKIVT